MPLRLAERSDAAAITALLTASRLSSAGLAPEPPFRPEELFRFLNSARALVSEKVARQSPE